MNDQKKVQTITSDWVTHIHTVLGSQRGRCKASDNNGNSILLEWEKVDPTSSRLNAIIKEASELLVQTYVPMELEFAKKHPETVDSEMFLKPLASLFQHGVDKVDWIAVEQGLTKNMHQFFLTTDFAKYSGQNDIQIFVAAKDEGSGATLGFIQFLITPQFEYGVIKAAFFGVAAGSENIGIEKLLLSMIFKLIPEVTRVFLHTRITNKKALDLYQDLGFVKFSGPLTFWADMEYLVQKSNVLQEGCRATEMVD